MNTNGNAGKFYRIDFNLSKPGILAFSQEPMFDAILAYAYHRENCSDEFRDVGYIGSPDVFDFSGLPIVLNDDGYYMASWMFIDEDNPAQGVSTLLKKWDEESDYMADFGKNKREVHIDRGRFKTTQIPIRTVSAERVFFFFQSGDIESVCALIKNHVFGIGKKISRGYGHYDSFSVQELDYNPFERDIIRPIPISKEDMPDILKQKNIAIQYRAFTFPYWLPENFTMCRVK